MRLRRVQEMEWGPLFVFDNALDSDDIKTILTLQNAGKIDEKGSSTGAGTPETPHFGIEMSPRIFNGSGLHSKLLAEIESRYCCTTMATKRIYITESRYGENTLIHADWWDNKKKGDLGITAIMFLNPVWKRARRCTAWRRNPGGWRCSPRARSTGVAFPPGFSMTREEHWWSCSPSSRTRSPRGSASAERIPISKWQRTRSRSFIIRSSCRGPITKRSFPSTFTGCEACESITPVSQSR